MHKMNVGDLDVQFLYIGDFFAIFSKKKKEKKIK